ncbi:MAG: SymE family type I addiction module toxin [Eubacterium sp.]|nr:SymE family type I addiction module toxin [Eubacterium sp.]
MIYEAPLGLNSKLQIPRIQLQGQWLEALGYHVDDKIDVQCTGDMIIINKMKTIKQAKRMVKQILKKISWR